MVFHSSTIAMMHGQINIKSGSYLPHGGAFEIDKQPLMRVETERVGKLQPIHDIAVLWTYEGRPWKYKNLG